jgi:predicted ATP-binding protein involved in virulence
MRLKSFQVENFRSIRDSGCVEVDDVTCLVGKNESGKTALLHALYRLNSINPEDGGFNPTDDYPRVDVDDYEYDVERGKCEPAIVIRAQFELEDTDIEEIAEDYSKDILQSREVELFKGYGNTTYFKINIAEEHVLSHLVASNLPQELAQETQTFNSLDDPPTLST